MDASLLTASSALPGDEHRELAEPGDEAAVGAPELAVLVEQPAGDRAGAKLGAQPGLVAWRGTEHVDGQLDRRQPADLGVAEDRRREAVGQRQEHHRGHRLLVAEPDPRT